MFTIALLVAGLLIGGVVGYTIGRQENLLSASTSGVMNQDQASKLQNLKKIEAFIADKGKFTNDDLESLLGVSNTTVGRYLEELEQAGKIKQVGETGRSVYYIKK